MDDTNSRLILFFKDGEVRYLYLNLNEAEYNTFKNNLMTYFCAGNTVFTPDQASGIDMSEVRMYILSHYPSFSPSHSFSKVVPPKEEPKGFFKRIFSWNS